ncbi:MAG: carboxypeptidase regulatory-like domain-containing protein, partial [Thermoplasmata archaeon]
MNTKKVSMVFFTIVLLFSSILPISVLSDSNQPPIWNEEWSNYQEIFLPIPTEDSFAIYQPIDIQINFDHSCWAKNKQEHSIRVVCWDENIWHELESQIYDLEFTDSSHINKCNLVFLVPEIADGKERYFVYYDNNEKTMPNYINHVDVEDSYYYYEPISGISAELCYYGITENDFLIYGIGQSGDVLNRRLSQAIIKNGQRTKSFDISNIGQIAVYSFSYQTGTKDEDDVSSDQELISKKIIVDGNLMVEFGIVTKSFGGEIRTTNIYKYYY